MRLLISVHSMHIIYCNTHSIEGTGVGECSTDLPTKLYVIFNDLNFYNQSPQIYIFMKHFLEGFD